MRRSLWWALGTTAGLTLMAVWTQQRAPALVSAIETGVREHARSSDTVSSSNRTAQRVALPLPTSLPPVEIEPAQRDIFASRQPAQAPVDAPQQATSTTPTPEPVLVAVEPIEPGVLVGLVVPVIPTLPFAEPER